MGFVIFFFVTNTQSLKWYYVPSTIAPLVLYYIFCMTSGSVNGDYVYFFLDTKVVGAGSVIGFSIGMLAASIGIAYLLYSLSKSVYLIVTKTKLSQL